MRPTYNQPTYRIYRTIDLTCCTHVFLLLLLILEQHRFHHIDTHCKSAVCRLRNNQDVAKWWLIRQFLKGAKLGVWGKGLVPCGSFLSASLLIKALQLQPNWITSKCQWNIEFCIDAVANDVVLSSWAHQTTVISAARS